jgi:PUA domain protein
LPLKTHFISKREVGQLEEKLRQEWPAQSIPKKLEGVMVADVDSKGRIFIAKSLIIVETKKRLVPGLNQEQVLSTFPAVKVNRGAIAHITNGADVMRPGIVGIEGVFLEGELVVVKDEVHNKALAIGISLIMSNSINKYDKGRVVENLHYVGDRLWQAYKDYKLGESVG